MICPICIKEERTMKGTLRFLGPMILCCGCRKAWIEHEFLGSLRAAGLNYYFTPDIHGKIVIYDPEEETHAHIEPQLQRETGKIQNS